MKWNPRLEAHAADMRTRARKAKPGCVRRDAALLEALPGDLSPLAFARRGCAICFGTGHRPRGKVCPCVYRAIARRAEWLREYQWETWVEANGGPKFPKSTWYLQAMR